MLIASTEGLDKLNAAESIQLDLSGFASSQAAVAVDTKKDYAEIDFGTFDAKRQTWQAPYLSDWAIAVGEFPNRTAPTVDRKRIR